MTATHRITAPVPGINGTGVGGLNFKDSTAVTDNASVIAYCVQAGYVVEELGDPSEPIPPHVPPAPSASVDSGSPDPSDPAPVEGVTVESDTAGAGEAVNADTGAVTPPSEQLPEIAPEPEPVRPARRNKA